MGDRTDFLPTGIPSCKAGKLAQYVMLLPFNFDLQNQLFKKPDIREAQALWCTAGIPAPGRHRQADP